MTTITNNTCGLELSVSVPSTLAEAASLFGEANVLTSAIRQAFYGPWNSAFRKAFVEKLEEITGVARRPQMRNGEPLLSPPKKDGTRTPILETEAKYLAFLQESAAISADDYARIGAEVAATITFRIPDADSQSAPSKEFVTNAKVILAKVEANATGSDGNPITEDSVTSKLEALNPGLSLEALGGFTVEGLARALQIDDKRRRAEAVGSLI